MAVGQRLAAFQTVGKDSAPSVIAAQHIRAYLADMDANAANELLVPSGQNPDALRDYENRRKEVTDGIVSAAQNITFGQSERVPIVTIADGLADYERAMTQARDAHERGDATMLAAYRRADDILHKTLLPAVDALDKVNDDALNAAYARAQGMATDTLLLTLMAGALLLAALGMTQAFLNRRTRRTLNPGLLAATILTVFYLFHTVVAFTAVANRFKTAKEDAFDSVRALWKTRAVAFDANADESRWLLDRPLASGYQTAFFEKSAKIAAFPAGQTADTIAFTYAQKQKTGEFKGFLADELNNITFPNELEAATEALRDWGQYLAIDGQLRQLENSGSRGRAVALCTGNKVGESNWAYAQFDAALDKTLELNQKEFDQNIEEGTDILKPYSILNPVAILLIAGLAFVGLLPRLREYAF